MLATMTESLPITLSVYEDAKIVLPKATSVANKLEAQLNFITMTAGWFSDPEAELSILFNINTTPFFPDGQYPAAAEFITIADDVHVSFTPELLKYECYIQITTSELEIAQLTKPILFALLDKKLTIVLNKIAEKQSLANI